MQELANILSDTDRIVLGNELDKLFIFQDKPFSKEKKAIFVQEISSWGIPLGALLPGIRSLMSEDLKSIKIASIREAAEGFIERTSVLGNCSHCFGGLVVMKFSTGHETSLACTCEAGYQKKRGLKLTQWNGENIQMLKNGLAHKREI